MKQIYLTAVLLLFVAMGKAQTNRNTKYLPKVKPLNHASKIIHHQSPSAVGDTVWIFDGFYSYDWDGSMPATYTVALEDVDADTIDPGLQPVFDTTNSYITMFDEDPTATFLHYGHPDTAFYLGATSLFQTPGQASNWIEFGPVHVPTGGGTLKWMHNYIDVNYRDGYEILVNTTGLAASNYTAPALFSVADNDTTTAQDTGNAVGKVWYPRQVNVSAFAGQDIYIAVHHNANAQFVLELTNIMLIEGSTVALGQLPQYTIGRCAPNPADASTGIVYSLVKSSEVNFTVTDLMGKEIFAQALGSQAAGTHRMIVQTASFAPGLYLYHFEINGERVTRKLVVSH